MIPDFCSDDESVTLETLSEHIIVLCDACHKEALIFQDEGNFCLNCWQDRTEPDITIGKEVIGSRSMDH